MLGEEGIVKKNLIVTRARSNRRKSRIHEVKMDIYHSVAGHRGDGETKTMREGME